MDRKQKIGICVSGIFMILLILLGITYGYFLTRVNGNSSEKSIDIETADLQLDYDDDNGTIKKDYIEPGDDIEEKTFTVTNNGTATIDSYGVYLEEVINTFDKKEDVTYTLTCTSNVPEHTCNGVTSNQYPSLNELLITNSIDPKEVHSYKLKVFYNETGIDQSNDMNKDLEGKIQIYNQEDVIYLTGAVSGYTDGDYIFIEDEGKSSRIVDGNYKIVGLKPANHTIKVIDHEGSEKGTKTFNIVRGATTGVSGDTITVSSSSSYATMNITSISSTLSVNITSVN